MKKHTNLTAYDNFESSADLKKNSANYCQAKIEEVKNHVNFIKKLFPGKKISVMELGSGNSKLLYALEKANFLRQGYGVEISGSRYKFAENWKKAGNFKNVKNINADALSLDYNKFDNFDLCFCSDLAFQFFEPAKKNSGKNILKQMYKKLSAGGQIILELDGCDRIIKNLTGNKAKLWEEFPKHDPWRFSLWDCRFNPKNKFLEWKKIFLKRNSPEISESKVILRVYKKNEIGKLLKDAGFSNIKFYANWKGDKFKDDQFEYIAIGKKNGK